MRRVKKLSLFIWFVAFPLLSAFLYKISEWSSNAHIDSSISFLAADAPVYYEVYLNMSDASILDNLWMLLNGSPILLMLLAEGDL